jgi:hypothetical protein
MLAASDGTAVAGVLHARFASLALLLTGAGFPVVLDGLGECLVDIH